MLTSDERVKHIIQQANYYGLPIEKMYEEKDKQLFFIIENEGIPLKEGVKELFSMLKERNYKIALGTSAKRERVEKQIKDKWLKESFDAIVCGDDVEKNGAIYGRRSDWKDLYAIAKEYLQAIYMNPGSVVLRTTDPRSTGKNGQEYNNPYQYMFQQMHAADNITLAFFVLC